MRTILRISFIAIVFFVYACNNDDDTPPENPNFTGTWTLVQESGGWLDNDTLHYPDDTGDTITWHFKVNDSLIVIKNGLKDGLGTYEIVNKESQSRHQNIDFLIFYERSSFAPIEYMITKHTNHILELTLDQDHPLKLELER